jgi:hypothetical protein
MSLEQKIDNLVSVIEKLVNVIEAKSVPTVVAQPEKLSAKPAEPMKIIGETLVGTPSTPALNTVVLSAPAPVVVPEPVAAPVAAPSMPPLPDFAAPAAPAPAAPAPAVPFSDPKGMTQYVMEAWKALGAKGPKMQEVIVGLGHHNINEIRPDQYGALYAGIEALKHGA